MKKFVVGGIVLMLVTCGWGTMSVGEQMPSPRGELRVVDRNPRNWVWITLQIFEWSSIPTPTPCFSSYTTPFIQPHRSLCGEQAVAFVPYVTENLLCAETSVTEQHWSVRGRKAAGHE